jgi:hypothetical protein
MKNTVESFARSWRLALLGALTALAAVLPALPAGAESTLAYSTYLGGSGYEEGVAVAAQGGNTFIAGITGSPDYPVVGASSDGPWPGVNRAAFVTALGPSGIPFYSTYVPVLSQDIDEFPWLWGISAGPDGSAYVAVVTGYRGMAENSIDIAKLEPSGKLSWQTGTGGRLNLEGMTVDSQGNVYITGYDHSERGHPDYSYRDEAFVWKINADGSHGYWSEIDGIGDGYETGEDIAVDAAGNAYVLGTTNSLDFPMAISPAPEDGWAYDAFVTKLGPTGSILWSTYLGGSAEDWGGEIKVAADGSSVVVVGHTTSPDFPTLNAIQTGLRGSLDLFLTRLKPWGQRISSTYLGGSGGDGVLGLALDSSSILLAVSSPGADSPLREPLDPACGTAYFAARLNATASRVLDAGCLGGGSHIRAVAADSSGISLTGVAPADLTLANAWQPSPAGSADAFATKVVLNDLPDCSAATASPATLWPADGRFVSVFIRGITDPDGDRVTIALTSVFQDEGLTKPGTPDATGLGTSTARLRATRLSGGNGRVYHLRFTATDVRGGACTGTVKVCVPPEQGGTCVDGGARVNSTLQ